MRNPSISRRTLLKAGGALAVGGVALAQLPSMVVQATISPGVARTLAVEPPNYTPSHSDEVVLQSVADPANTGRGEVRHVVSNTETTHYAVSLAQVRNRKLTLDDITSLSYDYYVPSGGPNTVGQRVVTSPDEVWLIVTVPGEGREEFFRTWPVHEPYQPDPGTWHTRDISAELRGLERSPWKRLHENAADFEVVGPSLPAAYGDARLLGVGFGRGDPVMGPSNLDIYYDNLRLNGQPHTLPG